ncbi:MAG: hypothetical protein KAS12_04020 [Candidatus Aenigmarchaeota archaeon]|nr:hypothetical protein [Candidatus Aenigmarchaeota archaeon]
METITGTKDQKPKISIARTSARLTHNFNEAANTKIAAINVKWTKDKNFVAIKKKVSDKVDLTEKEVATFSKYQNEIKEASSGKIRFSDISPKIIAALLSKATQDFLQIAMDQTLILKKKVIKPEHILYEDKDLLEERIITNLDLSPLFATSDAMHAKMVEIQTREKQKANKKEEEEEEKEEEEEVDDLDLVRHKTFKAYIKNIYDIIGNSDKEKYNHLRISNEIKEFLSGVLVEIIDRLSDIFKILIKLCKVKTVDRKIVVAGVFILMGDCGDYQSIIEKVLDPVLGCSVNSVLEEKKTEGVKKKEGAKKAEGAKKEKE